MQLDVSAIEQRCIDFKTDSDSETNREREKEKKRGRTYIDVIVDVVYYAENIPRCP